MEDDYLRPLPRYLEPHYKRLDDIGTSLGIVILLIIGTTIVSLLV